MSYNKVINGKRYNESTAKEVAKYSSDCGRSDFRWFQETLYLKRTGEFFLVGEGGPMTKYVKTYTSGTRAYGSQIIPLSESEACEWIEENANHLYEEYFPVEDDFESECEHISLLLPLELHNKLVDKSKEQAIKVDEYIVGLITKNVSARG